MIKGLTPFSRESNERNGFCGLRVTQRRSAFSLQTACLFDTHRPHEELETYLVTVVLLSLPHVGHLILTSVFDHE